MRVRSPYFAMIYSKIPSQLDRLFDGKDVFCKYTGHRLVRIGEGTKSLMYASIGGRKIIGEGTAKEVEYLPPPETLLKHGRRLFISERELDKHRREDRNM